MNLNTALVLALAGSLTASAVLAQDCNPHIRASAPAERYAVNIARGTVLDQQTGLTWKRCIEGQSGANCGTGTAITLDWGAALRRAEASTSAGYKDWRIPNLKELESLVEVACDIPAINATVFPNDPRTYVWTSTYPYPEIAKVVNFSHGDSSYANLDNRMGIQLVARLVRGGQ